ncbi:hypothetical protein QQF64_006049 [Cirrhinus molitorella]|uniref:Uncharacterized protein n=1 Tax=Cirrhinus molitorella TaxID=172907 RepID=A0ABR3MEE4_9TELE
MTHTVTSGSLHRGVFTLWGALSKSRGRGGWWVVVIVTFLLRSCLLRSFLPTRENLRSWKKLPSFLLVGNHDCDMTWAGGVGGYWGGEPWGKSWGPHGIVCFVWWYPKEASSTLEFAQRAFCGINSQTDSKAEKRDKLNAPVCTLLRKQLDFDLMG